MPQIQGSYAESGATQYVTPSAGAVETKVVKAAPGKVFSLMVVNVKASTIYLNVFDAATVTGTTLVVPPVKVPAGDFVNITFDGGWTFATGLSIASSSTQSTYTATTTADLLLAVLYK